MARLFVTGFEGVSTGVMSVKVTFDDPIAQGYQHFEIPNVPYNPASSTSVRQQIQDSLVPLVNARMFEVSMDQYATLIASDIEYVI